MLLICTATHGQNLRLAEHIEERANALGISAKLVDLSGQELPLYTSLRDQAQPDEASMQDLVDLFTEAKGFVFCAPEYNGSMPPTLSNAITWLSIASSDFRSVFNNKPAAIATHSGGGGQKVLMSMRIMFAHLGLNVLGRELAAKGKEPVATESIDDVLDRLKSLI